MPNGSSPPPGTDAPLTLTTLGGAGLFSPLGTELLGPGKPLALLIYLTTAPSRSVRREQLLTLLWADLPPDKARHALRQTLWFLRQILGVGRLRTSGAELILDGEFVVDRETFLLAIDRRELEVAVACYRANFLEGFAVPGGLDFEHWADVERQRLREAFLRSAEHLVRQWMDHGRSRDAVLLARRVRDAAPGTERAWRLLLEALRSAGDRLGFGMEAAALSQHFSEDSREPDAATRILLEAEGGGSAPAGDPGKNLAPALVGREREFGSIVRAWEQARKSAGRHIHLSAGPGLGKTRLLQEVHRRLRGLGARVVSLRANPGDHAIPFSFAGEIVRAVAELPGAAGVSPATAGSLVALHPPLSGKFHASPDFASGEDALHHRAAAIAELLEVVCDETPVALLLDDLHWADRPSRQLLLPLVARLERTHLLLVSATRPAAELAAFGEGGKTIHLSPIAQPHIAELLSSLGQFPEAAWSRELPGVLSEVTSGSPLLILETLQLSIDAGLLELAGPIWHCQAPTRLFDQLRAGGALQSRISRLDGESRSILLLLSLAGVPLSEVEIEAAAHRGREMVEPALLTLEQAGMVLRSGEAWQPIHDEIARQVIDSASAAERRAAHSGLGNSLYAGPGGSTVDLARAGHHLAAAKERATLRSAFVRYVRVARQEGDRRRLGFLAQQFLEGQSEDEVDQLVRTMGRLNRLRYGAGVRYAIAAMLAGVLFAGSLVGLAWWRQPDVFLMVRIDGQQPNDTVYEVPLARSDWDPTMPIGAREHRNVGQPLRISDVTAWIQVPDASGWYYVRREGNEETTDIFRMDRHHQKEPMAQYRHDDAAPTASPDGRYLVFTTSKYGPADASRDDYDLARRDLATGEVLQLTAGPGMDRQSQFSASGLLLGFTRAQRGTDYGCWMVPQAGEVPQCLLPAGYAAFTFFGWQDDATLIGIGLTTDYRRHLLAVDRVSGTATRLRSDVTRGFISPDSRWIAFVEISKAGWETWAVAPMGDISAARPIDSGALPASELLPYWAQNRPNLDPARELKIMGSTPVVRLDASFRLRAMVRTARGRSAEASPSWGSSDSLTAVVSSDGVVYPLRPGQVTIVARAGTLVDSLRLEIQAGLFRPVLREDWSTGISTNWIAFGDPKPFLRPWPGGGLAFDNGGDGSYPSGAYTRRNWNAADGLGVEAEARITVTRTTWQKLSIYLTADLDSAALRGWDHRTGPIPDRAVRASRTCAITYPGSEAAGLDTLVSVGLGGEGNYVPVPPRLGTGVVFRLRLQLFQDGRCGLAIDGHPVWRSKTSIIPNLPVAVTLGYSSYATEALHGPLEIWQGVKPDVAWSLLDSALAEGAPGH